MYKPGERKQMKLLPSCIEDYVSTEDPVRVYDAFVDALDFQELGIVIDQYKSGALEYSPKDMLKLIIYGYSYGIRSSRKLERACYHNLAFIWLMGDLKPDYRTISRFRSDNKTAIKNVLKQCVRMCVKLDLVEGNTIFIDGSCFRANASIKNTWTQERCEKHLKDIDAHIDSLIDECEVIDRQEESSQSLLKVKKELANKEALKAKIQEIAKVVKESGENSYNTVDPDCVKARSRQGIHAGYNAQIAVDEKNGLIVNSEATTSSQDYNQLSGQLEKTTAMLEGKPETVVADAGYYSLKDVAKVDKDVTVIIPSIKQAHQEKTHCLKDPFDKEQFKYNQSKDEYVCPRGRRLKYSNTLSNGARYYRAKGRHCRVCPNFGICTSSEKGRIITRQKEEELQDTLRAAYNSPQGQDIYKLRKEKVELTFGHFKRNLGAGQFMLRGKHKVDAELAVLSTCFNIARMITLIGIPSLILKLSSA